MKDGMNKIASERLKQIRCIQGLTTDALAGKIGKSGAFIRQLENGTSNFTLATLEDIAKALNVDITYLLAGENKTTIYKINDTINLPVLKNIQSGGFKMVVDEETEYVPTPLEMLKDINNPGLNAFWLISQSESMRPKVSKGDRLLLATDFGMPVKDRDLAVVVIDGAVSLKRAYEKPDSFTLVPENNKDEPIFIKKSQINHGQIFIYKVLGVFNNLK